jgi:hypothetical protein
MMAKRHIGSVIRARWPSFALPGTFETNFVIDLHPPAGRRRRARRKRLHDGDQIFISGAGMFVAQEQVNWANGKKLTAKSRIRKGSQGAAAAALSPPDLAAHRAAVSAT